MDISFGNDETTVAKRWRAAVAGAAEPLLRFPLIQFT
jgi:hypothetical protein